MNIHTHTGESISTNYNVVTYPDAKRVEVEIWGGDNGYQRIWFNPETLVEFQEALNDAAVRMEYPG